MAADSAAQTSNATGKRRVVITGLGVICPLGDSPDELWGNLMAGKSGIRNTTLIDEDELTCRISGECTDFDPKAFLDPKDAKRMDRYIQFAVAAAGLAYQDAGLTPENVDAERFGVVVGTGSGGIITIENQLKRALSLGFHKTSPFLVPMMLCDSGAGRISIEFNAKGPNRAVVTACATGADSIGDAFKMIQHDQADVMFAGGAEAPMCSLAVAGFAVARALSQREGDPTKASRPFDKDRDGFVMSEGGAILILEELEHAKKRGARIYGEIVGYGASADANDIVAPCEDGDGAARAMKIALKDARLQPEDIQYINAHGTSTPLGDIAETTAIKRVFGPHAKGSLKVSSTKSMHGHLLGAAGSLEAIISLLAIKNKTAPPTINLDNPDPQCDLDYVANKPAPVANMNAVMSNSFGFGGHNASLLFKAYEG
ncbi:MAG: beta-ketoacyl-ACP synthase II [Candidatus Melainabacteria bacterium]